MKDSQIPPWARSQAARSTSQQPRPTSDSGVRGPGERRSGAAGGSAPVRLSSLLSGVLGRTLDQAAEHAFTNATRDQLQQVAARMVELDRDKALACSFLLAWAAAGREPEVPALTPASMPWLFSASPDELRGFATMMVRLCPSAARDVFVGLDEELSALSLRDAERGRVGA